MDFCAAFVLIFSAIIGSFLLTSGKLDGQQSALDNQAISAAQLKGDVRVLDERTSSVDKKIDRIAEKLDVH